jgi:VWFA-related protein
MYCRTLIAGLFVLTQLAWTAGAAGQTNDPAQDLPSYRLNVAVDEVSVTFHASDARGSAVRDLKLDEVGLLDNGRPPRKMLVFESRQDFPLRVGMLMDMSESMMRKRAADRAIAIAFTERVLRLPPSQGFVMNFDRFSRVDVPWTAQLDALSLGIRNRIVSAGRTASLGGTAVFDAIYSACLNQFSHLDPAGGTHAILLFSDGEDNASRLSVEEAIGACQRNNTAIYAFHARPQAGADPSGAENLASMAEKTGGSVFWDDDPAAVIESDLATIEAELRSQYRIVYRPEALVHDGSFHRIELKVPVRVAAVRVRSGYYAPRH